MANKKTNEELFACGFAKLLEEQEQVDVELKAKDSDELGKSIFAHKLVLSARSEKLKKMMASTKLETAVTFSELTHTALEALVEFIYSDGSVLSENGKNHVWLLYDAAENYKIPHLRDLCRYRIIELCRMNFTSALNVLDFAQLSFDKALHDAAFGYIKCNISTVSRDPKFKDFVVKYPDLTVEIMLLSIQILPWRL